MSDDDDDSAWRRLKVGTGRFIALWLTLAALAYRVVVWQDSGIWPPLSLQGLLGLRYDLWSAELERALRAVSGLPVETWTLIIGIGLMAGGSRPRRGPPLG